MLYSVEQAFVGRDERPAPLKTPAWEANAPDDWPNSYVCVTVGPSDISKFPEGSLRTTDVSLRSSLLRDVSRGGTSATQQQKFQTDDAKSVRNPVRSALYWSTE